MKNVDLTRNGTQPWPWWFSVCVTEKMKQNGVSEEAGLYEMLQEYMVENEALR